MSFKRDNTDEALRKIHTNEIAINHHVKDTNKEGAQWKPASAITAKKVLANYQEKSLTVFNMVLVRPGNIMLQNGICAATMGYRMTEDKMGIQQPTYASKDMQAIRILPSFKDGRIDWLHGGVSQGQLGGLSFRLDKFAHNVCTNNNTGHPV